MLKNKTVITFSAVFVAVVMLFGTVLHTDWHVHSYGKEIPVGKNEKGFAFLKFCKECNREKTVYYDAMLTFVDDDGKTQALQHWENIMKATGISVTSALIASEITDETDFNDPYSYAGWDYIQKLKKKGMDFVNHTYSHKKLTSFTAEEIHQDLQKAKTILAEHKIKSDILVYPNNSRNRNTDAVVANYFNAAFCGRGVSIKKPYTINYRMSRININRKKATKSVAFSSKLTVDCHDVKGLEKLKSEMNTTVEKNGWLVYMSHAYNSPSGKFYFGEDSEKTIIEFCNYVKKLGNVKIITLTEGVETLEKIS